MRTGFKIAAEMFLALVIVFFFSAYGRYASFAPAIQASIHLIVHTVHMQNLYSNY